MLRLRAHNANTKMPAASAKSFLYIFATGLYHASQPSQANLNSLPLPHFLPAAVHSGLNTSRTSCANTYSVLHTCKRLRQNEPRACGLVQIAFGQVHSSNKKLAKLLKGSAPALGFVCNGHLDGLQAYTGTMLAKPLQKALFEFKGGHKCRERAHPDPVSIFHCLPVALRTFVLTSSLI